MVKNTSLFPSEKPHLRPSSSTAFFRYLIFIFARIGDCVIYTLKGVLLLLKLPFNICRYALKQLVYLIDKISKSYQNFKFHTIIIPHPRNIFFPKSQVIFHTSIFSKLKFPKVSLPKISLPQLSLPKFKFPYFHPSSSLVGFGGGVLFSIFFIFIPYNFYLFVVNLPNPQLLSKRAIPLTTQIFDRNNNLLYEIYNDENRKPVTLAQIPQFVKDATIAIEDKNFYYHSGFSPIAIARAAKETVINHNTQGGSTLTQQLIKNALLTPEVTLERKIKEIILSVWAEQIYSKPQILEMYLNQVPYGGTAWGIEAAAQNYFGKSVKDINLAEAAYLAGLPAAPTLYSPYGTRPDLAKVRQAEVLKKMQEDGYINPTQEQQALATPINIIPPQTMIKAPHFVMFVRSYLAQKFGNKRVDTGGLRVITTLDLSLQDKVQEIVANNIDSLKNLKVGNGAAMITNPQNGDILAMVGSKNYFDPNDGNVNVALATRQPGSSIKVVNYAAALQNGFTANSIIQDSPVVFTAVGSPAYAPVNYDSKFHGNVTLRSALANSYNVPAVKVLNKIGVSTMIDLGKKMGITTWDDESRFGLSLTLGGGDVTLYDMMQVYGTLANMGKRVDLDPILKITDYTGKVLYEKNSASAQQIIPSEIAFILSDILSDNSARSPAFGYNSQLNISGKTVAVKTGTTNEKRDNWTFGYTPSAVVGVWVGNNDNSPMDPYLTSGITGAAPIWNQIITEVLRNKNNESFVVPQNIIALPCFGKQEYFVRGTEPKGGCIIPVNPSPSPTPQ